MTNNNITDIINFYLHKYNVPDSIQDDVRQEVWCSIVSQEDWEEQVNQNILSHFGNAVDKWGKEIRSHLDVYQIDPEGKPLLNIIDLESQHLTLSDEQQSNLLYFILDFSPDQQRFEDLSLTEEQFKMYEKQYQENNGLIFNAYIRCAPDPPDAPENPERIPKKVKNFGEGHILYAQCLYSKTKKGVIEQIADLHNQGMNWKEIYKNFVYPPKWKGRYTNKPKATVLEIKAILQCMNEVSEEQLRSWLHINKKPLPVQVDSPDTLNCINDLEDLEAFLNIQLELPCKIIHEGEPYILVKKKCKTCDGSSQIRIYASDNGFTFSCGRCSAKNNHYGIYKRAGGNSLAGALRHLNILTREDYEL